MEMVIQQMIDLDATDSISGAKSVEELLEYMFYIN